MKQPEQVEPAEAVTLWDDEGIETQEVPRKQRIREEDLQEVWARFQKCRKRGHGLMLSCDKVAKSMGMKMDTVYRIVQRLRPTTDIAEVYLGSQALRLAMRLVRKAERPEQLIDILQRPNIGVLAPTQTNSGGANQGFFLSVSADSCGAVKVGVTNSLPQSQPPMLGQGGFDVPTESTPHHDAVDAEVAQPGRKNAGNHAVPRGPGTSRAFRETVIENAVKQEKRDRKAASQRERSARKRAKDQELRVADGGVEAARTVGQQRVGRVKV